MGNKQARNLSRPKDRGRPVTCDIFDLMATYSEPALTITLTTDLPISTRVEVLAQRTYARPDGSEMYWTALRDAFPVTDMGNAPAGITLRITPLELDTKGLHMFRNLKGRWPTEMAKPPSSELRLTVHAPTTEHRFGLCNRRLTGKAVTVDLGGHYLERVVSVHVPFAQQVLAKRPN